jgi:hypothetical protein
MDNIKKCDVCGEEFDFSEAFLQPMGYGMRTASCPKCSQPYSLMLLQLEILSKAQRIFHGEQIDEYKSKW